MGTKERSKATLNESADIEPEEVEALERFLSDPDRDNEGVDTGDGEGK